jgi:uncharacterized peroxidase-related enzyme
MFLALPPQNEARAALYSRDVAEDGYVANFTRLWAWRPDVFEGFLSLRKQLGDRAQLSLRERAILVCATAATLNDSYCALAWGKTLASEADPISAAAVLQGQDAPQLSARDNALAQWARQVARAPNSIRLEEVNALRSVGMTDEDIFDATVFVAFRIAFSTVNDALGARPDHEIASAAPAPVRDAVNYGRSTSEPLSGA